VRLLVVPALVLSLLPVAVVSAQNLPRGTVVDKVVCARDPSQSYALYVPAGYSTEREWPVLYAFDPGARGRVPVEQFREAADRYGFIVAGSNNSRNGPLTTSIDAMNAMLADTAARFGLNLRRVYVTGFSGGARAAATIGLAMKGQVAGVIGFGAGFPEGVAPSASVPFAFFGAAGTDDFNYPELKQLDQALERAGVAHRVDVFAGGHEWPPAAVCTRAVEWMELQAMRSGRGPRDAALVDQIFSRSTADAADEERGGRLLEACWLYAALAKDFAGLRDVSTSAERARQLGQAREVRQALTDLKDSVDKQAALDARIDELARAAGANEGDDRAVGDLLAAVGDVTKRADQIGRPADRMAARRVRVLWWSRFNEAASAGVARGNFARAAVCYRAMARMRPENARVEYNLACVCARNGDRKEAIDALRRAVAKGFADRTLLATDPDLESLRGEPAFRGILDSIGKR
jgi:predicted esterase